MANILGMYGPSDGRAKSDVDYPDVAGWPKGFVPIAIHTVDGNDYVATLLANLTELCGQTVSMDNFWVIRDSLLVEQIHKNNTLRERNKWFSDDLFKRMTAVHDKIHEYQNGVYGKPIIMNGLDIGNELQKIRGGSMFNDLKMHMDIKLQCSNQSGSNCKWINGLKYYVYSAHDSTIYAFFAILGIQNKVISPTGYPEYTAATFIELWRNRTDNQPYFKTVKRIGAQYDRNQ
ncbi:histidine acid phosphatase [Teladorsagia circumcincta]|uniref:Histidine acid phosphatase n=1 Tax=Teladorsagia circumcincta TaxID=45464 RepID=A0A2G9U403_TELCI|nr:histidine acid phosphatase [Teladorsagia circumcincta]